MTCENAVPNQQGQSFKGKHGNCRHITHMHLTVNSAMRAPNLAIRTWTCGTALAKWVVWAQNPAQRNQAAMASNTFYEMHAHTHQDLASSNMSTCKVHTSFSMCRILRHLNAGSWHSRTYLQ